VPGILGELSRGDETNQIDHSLQVGSARPREVSAQMLTAESDGFGQFLCRNRAARVRDDDFPRAALQLRGESQNVWRLAQRLAKARGKSVRIDEIARGVVVDSLDDDVDETESGASSDRGGIGSTQRQNSEKGSARKFSSERCRLPGVVVGCAEVDERGIDENAPKHGLHFLGGSGGDDLPPPPRERGADERSRALSLEMNEERRQRRAVGGCRHS